MAVVSLPLSFKNSFWSQDYRKGLEVLFNKLEQGVVENDEIVAFIRNRIIAESQLALALINPMLTGSKGFGADDGASLLMAFRGLQSESAAQGKAHQSIAKELETLVIDPFDEWAESYKARLGQSRHAVLDTWMKAYEQAQSDVAKLKQRYLLKVRKADEAEDDAKFAPNSNGLSDTYTTSPRIRPADTPRAPPQRTPSVSERIAQRLREIQKRSADTLTPSISGSVSSEADGDDEKPAIPKIDKGKGKEILEPTVLSSPPPMSPPLPPRKLERDEFPKPPVSVQPMLLAGLSLTPAAVSQLLTKAASDLNLRPVRVPLLGEYQDCFTGEEFVAWLNDNVDGFGGSLDKAEEAAKDLTERESLLRRIGEFGNNFEHSDEAYYQFRPKAFDVEGKNQEGTFVPVKGENLFKRTNDFVSLVSKALNAPNNGLSPHATARQDAEDADQTYRLAVRKLDRQRLVLEERIEETLKTLQRWELERLRAVKTVLLQYQGTVSNLPKSLEPSIERSGTLIAAYQPESDLNALIERYRTGPFRPDAQVYESVSHDESDVLFGIDLRKWAEGSLMSPSGDEKKEYIPPVLKALLNGLSEAYSKLPDDAEKRKSWIYEVPLQAPHHLRESLNTLPSEVAIPGDLLTRYDAPVIASAIKLWLLELDPPVALYEGWDEFRKVYPTVGSASVTQGDAQEEERIKTISATLQRLPRVHLFVLDALIKHLKTLMASTTVEESDEVYTTKLALSIGRTILRPKFESEISIQDRHPTLLFIDLIKNYDAILPPTIARKKRESERKIPFRKRTAIVDMRQSRNKISVGSAGQSFVAPIQAKSPELKAPTPLPAVRHPMPTLPASPPQPPESIEQLELPSETPTSPPAASATQTDLPPRPAFRAPPPEDDDLPPRPAFKEPPPDSEDDSAPPRPNFAEPPPEEEETPTPGIITVPETEVATSIPLSLKTDLKRNSSITSRSGSQRGLSRSPSPTKSALARSARAEAGALRGPRVTKGPRAPGGSVSSMVSNFNRNSVSSGSPSPTSAKRLSGSPSRRPSSVLGRSAAFRRTMGSDAEDDVVGKK